MKRILNPVLLTVVEYLAAGTPTLSNGVTDMFRITTVNGIVTLVELGCQYYVASNKESGAGKVAQWAPITCEQFVAQGGQIADRGYFVYDFDVATGKGVGNGFDYRYVNAPEVGAAIADCPMLIPQRAPNAVVSTVKASRYSEDGGKSAPKRKVVVSAPVVASAIDRPAPTLAEQEILSGAFQIGADETSTKERDIKAGKVRETASAAALRKAQAKQA